MTNQTVFEAVGKYFDAYSRTARLYPSLLALGPLIWTSVTLYPSIIDTAGRSVAFGTAAACIFYFLTSVARSLGKRAEERLLRRWGGWPTTILLRHSDTTIDRITKNRYHRALEKLCHMKLPTPDQERSDQAAADDSYRSATKNLLEHRRGPAYNLIHHENRSYGFRRNFYGLKTVVIIEVLIVAGLTAFGCWLIVPQPYTYDSLAQSVIKYPHFPALLAADLGYLLLWIFVVTPTFVYQAGREYAEALLRTLEK
jgi:hypothetical protein